MNTTCGERFARIETRINGIDRRLDDISAEIKGTKWWIIGAWGTGVAIVLALAAYQASWFMHSLDVNREISNKTEARVEKIQGEIDAKFAKIEEKIDTKFDKLLERFPAPPAKQ